MSNQKHSTHGIVRFVTLMIVGVGMTIAAGLVHGRFTQRWGPLPDLEAAARNLEAFPTTIGDWQLVSEEPMSETIVRTLSCAGYVNRQYVNRRSGRTVSIAIIVGPPGPTAVHTPEICFSSRNYAIQEPRQQLTLSDSNGRAHSFWTLAFRSNTPSTDRLQVNYAWRASDVWTASKSPRFEFAGRRLLYKLQVASLVPAKSTDKTLGPCQDFLSAMLHCGWKISGEGS
jgi:hypothetical protein